MVSISRRDLEALAVGFGIADFFAEGKLSAPIGRATKAALRKAAPAIARGIIRYGPAAVSTAARVTPTGLVASTAGVLAIQNREKIADLAAQGFEVTAPVVGRAEERARQFIADPVGYSESIGVDFNPFKPTIGKGPGSMFVSRKRKSSKFNKAVSAGMKAAKASASYGKKGTINNAKKAFTAVTKTASRINKGGKVAKKGIQRKIGLAIKKVLRK
tara:strand:- start:522 stop:1169 length:648 start_codon:yes stop_codon:yes gene_type:complete